jgi:hypothetical protein
MTDLWVAPIREADLPSDPAKAPESSAEILMEASIMAEDCACPSWAGYLLASPIRKLLQNPNRILSPYVRAGMNVLEPGPGMGFFTLELARLVGLEGRVRLSRLRRGIAAAPRMGLGRDPRLALDSRAGFRKGGIGRVNSPFSPHA